MLGGGAGSTSPLPRLGCKGREGGSLAGRRDLRGNLAGGRVGGGRGIGIALGGIGGIAGRSLGGIVRKVVAGRGRRGVRRLGRRLGGWVASRLGGGPGWGGVSGGLVGWGRGKGGFTDLVAIVVPLGWRGAVLRCGEAEGVWLGVMRRGGKVRAA